MKLFLQASKQPELFLPNSFVGSLLQYLYVTEAIAAKKYKELEVIPSSSELTDHITNQCIQRQFTANQTASAVAIFQEIAKLSHLIQLACFAAWEGNSKETVQKIGKLSEKKILPPFDTIKEYKIAFTDKILDNLVHPNLTGNISTVQTLLVQCFPNINQSLLRQSIDKLGLALEKFKTSAPSQDVEEIGGEADMIEPSELRTLNFFQPATAQVPASTPYCTIS